MCVRAWVCMCVHVHGQELGEVREEGGTRWLKFQSVGNGEPLKAFE